MTNSNVVLKTKLSRAGITLKEPTTSAPLEPPWFVRALQAFTGWLAALFLLGFIAMGVVFVVESSAASMGLARMLHRVGQQHPNARFGGDDAAQSWKLAIY